MYSASKFALDGLGLARSDELEAFGIRHTVLEPGSLRTEFLGPKTLVHAGRRIPDYEASRAGTSHRELLGRQHGNQAGSPRLAAELIFDVVASEDPPTHLPVGADAVQRWDTHTEARDSQLDEWRARASSIAFGDPVTA